MVVGISNLKLTVLMKMLLVSPLNTCFLRKRITASTTSNIKSRRLYLFLCNALAIACLVFPGHGYAARVNDIYRAQIPVEDQSETARRAALEAGLISVVDRATGSSDWRQLLSEKKLVSHTQLLLEQFGYVQSGSVLRVDVRFSDNAVNALLAQYGISVWGENRPRVLFWIAIESAKGRSVISENTRPGMVDRLQRALSYWGIPGLTPLMDIEDNSRLNVSDLWGFFDRPVELASKRYASDAFVMARVNRDAGGRWNLMWQLRAEGETIDEGLLEARSTREWIETLSARVSSSLASIYAVQLNSSASVTDDVNTLLLAVKGIQSFEDYVDVYRLLKSLAPVKEAFPHKVLAGEVQFELSLTGLRDQVIDHLALHQELTPTLAEELTESAPQLVYLWRP